MNIDLEEIKQHRARWEPDDSTSLPTICAHMDALIAEVEVLRLRRDTAYAEGILAERAGVTAFLRHAQTYPNPTLPMGKYLSALITLILAGEHHDRR